MDYARKTLTLALLGMIACGPSGLGSDPSVSEATGESTSAESTTESGPMPTTDAFIPGPDMPVTHCDPFMQNCSEGEKCVPYSSTGGSWDGHKCVPVMGDKEPGEPCSYGGAVEATDDCDETGVCWDLMNIDGELLGTCHAFCGGTISKPECPPKSSCVSSSSVYGLCIPNCDPILQDCDPGLACFWAISGFWCVYTTADIAAGEPCGYINDCAAGLSCTSAAMVPDCEGAACCSPFCDLDLGDAQCEALPGSSCMPFLDGRAPPPGFDDVGVCMLP